jgi:hypothetical protein
MQQRTLQRFLAGIAGCIFMVASAMCAGAAGPVRETLQAQGQEQAQTRTQPGTTQILNQKLIWTGIEGDSARVALNAGFSNIGVPVSINRGHPCTVAVQTMVQVESPNDPYWAICPTIDGFDAVDSCNFQGLATSTSDVYVTGNGVYFWSLSAGKHTLQPQIYLNVIGAIDNWGMIITKYNPI